MIRFASPQWVPLETAFKWQQDPDWIYEEKKDGKRAFLQNGELFGRSSTYNLPRPLPANLITIALDGELCGSVLFIFDILRDTTGDIGRLPLFERRKRLLDLSLPDWMQAVPSTRGNGGEYLEAVLANGGEGVVAKRISAPYGVDWFKAKRVETFDCVVVEWVGGAIRLGQFSNGKLCDCGKCAICSLDVELSSGDVVEIEAHSRHKSGKLREPRFLRKRDDKRAEECLMKF